MSSSTPTIRQTAWISAVPQLIVMGLLIFFWFLLNSENAFIYGVLTYLLVSFSLRTFIPQEHRKGMKKVKKGNFNEGIPHFEKSYGFFKKHEWIDRYRYLVLLSSSRMSYREMALNNIAFCYGQLGEGRKAKEAYERTLTEFPESGIAITGLRLLNSMLSARD